MHRTTNTTPKGRSLSESIKLRKAANSSDQKANIQNPTSILTASLTALEKHREIIIGHEEKFAALSLGPRLQMGLAALQAYQVFCIPPDQNSRGGRKPNNRVTRDTVLEKGFEGWLETKAQWFKRPTAYKYMTAVRGLGLDHSATEKQVANALKMRLRKGPVTLKDLCDAATELINPPAPPPTKLQQSEFEFLCSGLKEFREEAERILALKDQLMANPEMHKVACARAYDILTQLTGTNWTPSDEPDALASVDPDSLAL